MTEATITLGSDWTVAGIAAQWSQVSACLAELRAGGTDAGSTLFISMAATESLDACGCQLLAVFVRTLKGIGIDAYLVQVPETLRSTIDILGFSHHFTFIDDRIASEH